MKLGNVAAMVLVTIFAVAVMLASGTKLFTPEKPKVPGTATAENTVAAPVDVVDLRPERVEITQRYSGMIRPFERMTLAFEIPGRIEKLGKNANGQTFDDGVRVAAGDTLAVLDTRELKARQDEAVAVLEQAQHEMDRATQLRQKNDLAISQTDFLNRQTTLRIAKAQADLAMERLRDASLVSPVDGVIAKRMLLPGESVNSHQPVFQLIQVDKVLLVVGVPESKIRPLLQRFDTVRRLREVGDTSTEPFRAYVELIGGDSFGTPWKPLEGEVRTIGESSDETTGLFEVEILILNREGTLRPGQIAVAKIVVDVIEALRIPSTAAIFQEGNGFLYCVRAIDDQRNEAFRLPLPPGKYLEQNQELIVRDWPLSASRVVVRGQHRLAPGRLVRILDRPAGSSDEFRPEQIGGTASEGKPTATSPAAASRSKSHGGAE